MKKSGLDLDIKSKMNLRRLNWADFRLYIFFSKKLKDESLVHIF